MSTGASGHGCSRVEGRIAEVHVPVRAEQGDVTRLQDAAVELLVSEQLLEPDPLAPVLPL